jgi:hypothetical protein
MKNKNGDMGLVGPFRMGHVRPAGQHAPYDLYWKKKTEFGSGERGDWNFNSYIIGAAYLKSCLRESVFFFF